MSLLDILPSSTTTMTKEGIQEQPKQKGFNLIDLLKSLFSGSSQTTVLTNPNAPKKTGPGYDQPMLQPSGAPKAQPIPQVMAAEAEMSDILSGYNKSRGMPKQDILDLIEAAAAKHKLDPNLIAAILFNESGFRPDAYNENIDSQGRKSRDRGIAQLNSIAHPEITDEQANDPNFALDFMARKLKADIEHFGDPTLGVAAYNVGRGGANSRSPKGNDYLKKVYANLNPEYAQKIGLRPNY